ncbi:uncharacterized protein DS421_11g338850 [Arachis hypogaea]|nr:uncharacterized protein DS421_11g338850 [Arachis hypogaea]
MKGGKRAEREEEEEFSSLLCAHSSSLLPIPSLMLPPLRPLKLAGEGAIDRRNCCCSYSILHCATLFSLCLRFCSYQSPLPLGTNIGAAQNHFGCCPGNKMSLGTANGAAAFGDFREFRHSESTNIPRRK